MFGGRDNLVCLIVEGIQSVIIVEEMLVCLIVEGIQCVL